MKALNHQQIRLAATDLSNHSACRHVTTLDLQVARGILPAPQWAAPDLVIIQERGKRHEAAFLIHLAEQKKLAVANLEHIKDETELLKETQCLMDQGAEVIAQGALAHGDWFGRPDVLLRVPKHSTKWKWSYEVLDTKLARETKAATILQLSLYSQLLEIIQGCQPETMWVIPPGNNFAGEAYRVAEYAAYVRYVKDRLVKAVLNGHESATYPEPVEHCNVCRWFRDCDAQRRAHDHLSLVAGIRRQQRNQLEQWDTDTMAKLAVLPIPLQQKPEHGSRDGIERVREQARVQVQGRTDKKLVHEPLLPPAEGIGLCRLPEPSPADLFLDLEGDPFVDESGLQYLFGMAFRDAHGELTYERRWALNRQEEKKGFEWLVDEIMRRRELNPKMHVYHFGAYEPSTLKRLMGMYATREDQIDRMLRAGVLVDLHQAFKQSTRASLEEYSLKKIEAFYGFARKTPLDVSRAAMRYVEHRLELGWENDELPDATREAMEGYNSEDCFSTAALRDWLENERQKLLASGTNVPRFTDRAEEASEELDEKQKRVAALVEQLTAGIPADANNRTKEQQAQWLLSQLLDWHRRENKATYWEGFRLADLNDEDLLDDRAGLAGLQFMQRLIVERTIPVDRYSFEKQETEARCDKDLYYQGKKFGCVVAIDAATRTIDVKKTRRTADVHPGALYLWERPFDVREHAEALLRIGEWVAKNGIAPPGPYQAGRDLLLGRPPRLSRGETPQPLASEMPENTASRIVLALADSVLAIQGPPGSGKTYTGARMICELVRRGKKIGVTALSHKVIRNLLDAVVKAAEKNDVAGVLCMHRETDGEESDGVAVAKDNDEALAALQSGRANVLGGTSWLWSPQQAFESVDVLFIDEAGQMALADVLALSHSAKNLVLLGDPQQLERPLKGSHPDGAQKSALEHMLEGRKTIAQNMGFLLPRTWRLHPSICAFTSELFYEQRLQSEILTHSRVLEGHPRLNGAGLWFVPAEHQGNSNSSAEEVEVVEQIVLGLLKPDVKWFYGAGRGRRLREDDILIVAPYNAQVADLSARLPKMRIGTVDKFQGQEAPVVIYSLTTSSPEDAPHGMEFLFSLNRLNVATSRAMSTVIVVGNPRLFEPDCRTPRQMQLANALCRFRELATTISVLRSN